jgi:6-phosphogluconolactonase (cycloisomerase 2 family)
VDPLQSQGSLAFSDDGSQLYAVNAGSGTVSVFRVLGSSLDFEDVQPTYGVEPVAIAQHGNLVYVANSAAASNVVGFRIGRDGQLTFIPNSLSLLSGADVGVGSIAISPDGAFLAVTERNTNNIDIFKIQGDGTLAPIVINHDATPGTFALVFAPDGALLVAETGPAGQTNASAISSFFVGSGGTLTPVSPDVPTLGAAACWLEVTPNGKFAYVSNAGTATISGFLLGPGGALSPLPGTVLAKNPAGSSNIDIAVSADSRFLYTLNAGNGTVGVFAVQSSGGLTPGTPVTGLPVAMGLNGIAAN